MGIFLGGACERSLRPEVERELRPEQTTAQRCKTLSELQLQNMKLEEVNNYNNSVFNGLIILLSTGFH